MSDSGASESWGFCRSSNDCPAAQYCDVVVNLCDSCEYLCRISDYFCQRECPDFSQTKPPTTQIANTNIVNATPQSDSMDYSIGLVIVLVILVFTVILTIILIVICIMKTKRTLGRDDGVKSQSKSYEKVSLNPESGEIRGESTNEAKQQERSKSDAEIGVVTPHASVNSDTSPHDATHSVVCSAIFHSVVNEQSTQDSDQNTVIARSKQDRRQANSLPHRSIRHSRMKDAATQSIPLLSTDRSHHTVIRKTIATSTDGPRSVQNKLTSSHSLTNAATKQRSEVKEKSTEATSGTRVNKPSRGRNKKRDEPQDLRLELEIFSSNIADVTDSHVPRTDTKEVPSSSIMIASP